MREMADAVVGDSQIYTTELMGGGSEEPKSWCFYYAQILGVTNDYKNMECRASCPTVTQECSPHLSKMKEAICIHGARSCFVFSFFQQFFLEDYAVHASLESLSKYTKSQHVLSAILQAFHTMFQFAVNILLVVVLKKLDTVLSPPSIEHNYSVGDQ